MNHHKRVREFRNKDSHMLFQHDDDNRHSSSLDSSSLSEKSIKIYRNISKFLLVMLIFTIILSCLFLYDKSSWIHMEKKILLSSSASSPSSSLSSSSSSSSSSQHVNNHQNKSKNVTLLKKLNKIIKQLQQNHHQQQHQLSNYSSYLNTLLHQIKSSKDKIYNYWDVSNYPNFLTMMDIPYYSWDIQKAKFIKFIIEQSTRRISSGSSSSSSSSSSKGVLSNDNIYDSSDDENDDFVVGFSGSSVTAGHGE